MWSGRPLLLVFGTGDQADQMNHEGNRVFVTGSADLGRLLPNREALHRLQVSASPLKLSDLPNLSPYPVVVNMITEAEHSAKVLENLRTMLRDYRGRVVNPPRAVLSSTRDKVARRLSGIEGLTVPPVVRLQGSEAESAAEVIAKAGIGSPIILRKAGTHTGDTVALHNSVDEAVATMESGQTYFATQFVDFASGDGLYRKYRLWFIGARAVLRHMYVSDHWNVHSKDRARFMGPRPDLVAEERALIGQAEPFTEQIRQTLSEVRRRMPLDFFGLDFGIVPDGKLVFFEANATMSFFPLWRDDDPQFEYLKQVVPPAQAAFMQLVGMSGPAIGSPRANVRVSGQPIRAGS